MAGSNSQMSAAQLVEHIQGIEAKVDRIYRLLGVPTDRDDDQGEAAVGIFKMLENLQQAVEKAQEGVDDIPAFVETRIVSSTEDVMDSVQVKFDILKLDVGSVRREIRDVAFDGHSNSSKVRVPDPKTFGGERSAKELENFLWDMEAYFRAAHVSETEKVSITAMYLAGDAKLWWRSRSSEEGTGRGVVENWEALKKELRDQFLPSNSSWVAREALRKLKHTGTIRDFVKNFSSLMLDVREMSEEDKLFNFMAGLQPWAQTELRRFGVKDLQSAIAAADGLLDFQAENSSAETREISRGDAAGKKKKFLRKEVVTTTKTEVKPNDSNPKSDKLKKGCWVCGGDHLKRNCPLASKITALFQDSSGDEEESVQTRRLNSMQVVPSKGKDHGAVGE